MTQGHLADLRQNDAVIVDMPQHQWQICHVLPDGRREPLKIGNTMELNDHRAVVAGICKVTRPFQSQPIIYTTYSRSTIFAPANAS